MSEELTKLIDKTIGKKGRLRVPAYWMHKVLSGIVAYVREQVEKLEKLDNRIQEITPGAIDYIVDDEDYPNGKVLFNQTKPAIIFDLLRWGSPYIVSNEHESGVYKIYAFLNYDSAAIIEFGRFDQSLYFEPKNLPFGFYELTVTRSYALDFAFSKIKAMTPANTRCYIHVRHTIPSHEAGYFQAGPNTNTVSVYNKGQEVAEGSYHYPANSAGVVIDFIIKCNSVDLWTQMFFSYVTLYEVGTIGVRNLSSSCFKSCINLLRVELDDALEIISSDAFYGCKTLSKVILRAKIPPTLQNSSAFAAVNNSLNIYVPDESVETYKAASNWSTFADRIKPLSELTE